MLRNPGAPRGLAERAAEEAGVTADRWLPYCGAAPAPDDWLARWNSDMLLIGALALTAAAGWRRASSRPMLLLAVMLAALLFVSPLCALTSALFSARVAHHVALTSLIAPALVIAMDWRARGLALWTALHAVTMWGWLAPGAYAAALSSDVVYWAMQATLFVPALGFWASLRTARAPGAIAALLATMVQMGLLGALLTLAPDAYYAPHWLTTAAWGLSPLEDQQLAGLVLWAPAAGLYLGAALLLAWRLLGSDPRQGLAA